MRRMAWTALPYATFGAAVVAGCVWAWGLGALIDLAAVGAIGAAIWRVRIPRDQRGRF